MIASFLPFTTYIGNNGNRDWLLYQKKLGLLFFSLSLQWPESKNSHSGF